MKYVSKISALIAFLALVATPFAIADSQADSYKAYTLPSFTVEGVSDPELQSYVTPRIPSYLLGSTVTMYYTINEKGDIQSTRSNAAFSGRDLAQVMTDALREWKFEPATNSAGEPVAIRVAMPVQVVEQGSNPIGLASISVTGMKLTANSI